MASPDVFHIAKVPFVFWDGVERSMGFVDPEIDEEGLPRCDGFFDEGVGVHGVFVDGHLLAGTIEGAVFVVAILGGSGRIGDHVIGEVPFTVVGGGVAGLLEELGNRNSAGVEPIWHSTLGIAGDSGEVAIDFIAGWKVSRHDAGAAG